MLGILKKKCAGIFKEKVFVTGESGDAYLTFAGVFQKCAIFWMENNRDQALYVLAWRNQYTSEGLQITKYAYNSFIIDERIYKWKS